MVEFIAYITFLIACVVLSFVVGFNTGWSKSSKRTQEIVEEAIDNDDNTR